MTIAADAPSVSRAPMRSHAAFGRLMLLAYISIVTAAIARIGGLATMGPPVFFGLMLLFVVFGVLHDLATRRQVHRAYIWGGTFSSRPCWCGWRSRGRRRGTPSRHS